MGARLRVDRVRLAPQAHARRGGGDARLRPRASARTRSSTPPPACFTTSTTSATRTSAPGTRARRSSCSRARLPARADRCRGRARDFLGVPRESRMAKTLYAVDELSGFVAACAYVRPDGRAGHDAQVRQEEAEAAELRRRGQPRRGPRRGRGARRGLRRARGVRDRRAGGARGRARAGPREAA